MFTFALTAKHGDMHTFTQSENGAAIAFVRGFGANESQALENAKQDLSSHACQSAQAPRSHKERSF